MSNNLKKFIESHNLVNRIYDMVCYFGVIKSNNREEVVKRFFKQQLGDISYVESLAKYFENKLNIDNKNIELKYNLQELVYDLNYLKQYMK